MHVENGMSVLFSRYFKISVTILFPNWAFRHAMRCLLDHEAAGKRINLFFDQESLDR